MNQQADPILDDDLVTSIFAYVEREAGRDAPLSPEDEALVRQLLETNPAAQALADDFRVVDQSLKDVFDLNAIDVPDSLVSLVRTYDGTNADALKNQGAGGQLIPFPQAPAAKTVTRSYRPQAAAAAIALVIAGGSLLYQHNAYDQARQHDQTKLAEVETALAARSDDLQQARKEQRGLRLRLATLTADNHEPGQRIDDDSRQQVAEGEIVRQVTAPAGSETAGLEDLSAELSEALSARDQELADVRATLTEAKRHIKIVESARIETLQQGQEQVAGLEAQVAESRERLANLTAERDRLAGKVQKDQERIAALESTVNTSLAKVVALNSANDQLAAEKHHYQTEASWLHQVAGYHRGYAGTMREVEVSAEQQDKKQMVTTWLSSMMGRNVTLPDLSGAGLTFIGGRVFFVNGVPTAQIAYHDAEGRLTGFCFTESPDQADHDLNVSQDEDLNLVSWGKQGVDYVLIGWTDAPELKWIAKGLQKSYGDEI